MISQMPPEISVYLDVYSAMLRKEMVHIYDAQSTEGYCEVILIKN